MNNNRGNNNRRRGRGNNRQQGGQQTNRIDSRARGNAPQMLDKYKKLAHDAHLNGDRVAEEYNLQFADHYFRVIADQKQRQDEARQPRRDDRSQDYDDDGSDDDTYGDYNPSGAQAGGQPGGHAAGNERSDRADRKERPERTERAERPERAERSGGEERGRRSKREPEANEPVAVTAKTDTAEDDSDQSIYEPEENPFVRPSRGLKQRRPRGKAQDSDPAENDASGAQPPAGNFDPAILPPAISSKAPEKAAPEKAAKDEGAEEKPKRRRTRKASPPAEDGDGKLEAVNG